MDVADQIAAPSARKKLGAGPTDFVCVTKALPERHVTRPASPTSPLG